MKEIRWQRHITAAQVCGVLSCNGCCSLTEEPQGHCRPTIDSKSNWQEDNAPGWSPGIFWMWKTAAWRRRRKKLISLLFRHWLKSWITNCFPQWCFCFLVLVVLVFLSCKVFVKIEGWMKVMWAARRETGTPMERKTCQHTVYIYTYFPCESGWAELGVIFTDSNTKRESALF